MAYLMSSVLRGPDLSAIHTLLYMSVNEPFTVDHPVKEAQFWIPWSRGGKPTVPTEFLERLSDAWLGHSA